MLSIHFYEYQIVKLKFNCLTKTSKKAFLAIAIHWYIAHSIVKFLILSEKWVTKFKRHFQQIYHCMLYFKYPHNLKFLKCQIWKSKALWKLAVLVSNVALVQKCLHSIYNVTCPILHKCYPDNCISPRPVHFLLYVIRHSV